MLLETGPIEKLFNSLEEKHVKARANLGRPLTVVEKILYSHMDDCDYSKIERGASDILLQPDRVAMQDATAKWQFCNSCLQIFLRLQCLALFIVII